MNLSTRVLGSTVAHDLAERATAPVLTIGRDRFARGDLAAIACFNFNAAANLSRALASFKVASTRDVFERIAPSALALPHVGAVALAVLGAAFERKGLGGAAPLEAWMIRHSPADVLPADALATFSTVKHRAADEARAERHGGRRARPHAHRNKAHRIRVARSSSRRYEVHG
jgi:hypothetical protein